QSSSSHISRKPAPYPVPSMPGIWIAVTPGEPAGIGPELLLALSRKEFRTGLVVIADPELLRRRAHALRLPVELEPYHSDLPARHEPGRLVYQPVAMPRMVQPGQPDPANAGYLLECIRNAVRGC